MCHDSKEPYSETSLIRDIITGGTMLAIFLHFGRNIIYRFDCKNSIASSEDATARLDLVNPEE